MSAGADIIEEVRDLWNEVETRFAALRETINRTLDKVPGFLDWIFDRVQEGWAKFCATVGDITDQIKYMIDHPGRPWDLSATADRWSTGVGGPVSAHVADADAGLLLVDDNWTGDAADQYKQHIPLQKAALKAVKSTFTDTVGQALDKVQLAIIVFWGALGAGLAALVAGIIAAVSSAATVFGLPAAPFIAAGAALIFDACLVGGVLNLKAQASSARTMLVAKLADNTDFPGGAWPPGTA